MTTPSDTEIRAALERWAQDIDPSPGDPHAAMSATPGVRSARPHRVLIRAGAAAVAVAVVAGSATAWHQHQNREQGLATQGIDGSTASTPASDPATDTSSGEVTGSDLFPGQTPVAFRPADPAWRLTQFQRDAVDADGGRRGALTYEHPDGRRLIVPLPEPLSAEASAQLGAGGAAPGPLPPLDPRTDLTVRTSTVRVVNLPMAAPPAGAPAAHQVLWAESDHLWSVMSQGFADVESLTAVLADLQEVDDATFLAQLPPSARGPFDQQQPDEMFSWTEQGGALALPSGPLPTEPGSGPDVVLGEGEHVEENLIIPPPG